ncbi:MAG: glutamine amidotransferase [Methanopyri archaeon]|nr:glutamine amidotransferase [Methanopyri archaeon]
MACGIAGVVLPETGPVGQYLTEMLDALQHRGPDSAGYALYRGTSDPVLILELPRNTDELSEMGSVEEALPEGGRVSDIELIAEDELTRVYRVHIEGVEDGVEGQMELAAVVETLEDEFGITVLSAGHGFEILKDVGTAEEVSSQYGVSALEGTHGIGHVRFSTESEVDRYHAHPFQSYMIPNMAVVHNGQITNYYSIREILEIKGYKFKTNNDSECIIVYIADKLMEGYELEEALEEAIRDLDGPFCFIVSTPEGIGVVRDPLGLRPGVIGYGKDDTIVVASEEVAIRRVLGDEIEGLTQIRPGEYEVFTG